MPLKYQKQETMSPIVERRKAKDLMVYWDHHIHHEVIDERTGKVIYVEILPRVMPLNPLTIRPLVDWTDNTPPGCCGFVHWSPMDGNHLLVADAQHIGHFWPAIYDYHADRWLLTGAGFKMVDGIRYLL